MAALIFLSLLVFILSLINLKYGVFTAIIELIIGSKGHLLTANIAGFNFSLRMGIFCGVMLATLIYFLRNKNFQMLKNILTPRWLIFAAVLLWGVAFAILRENKLSLIFQDFNAYFYFLYLIPFYIVLNEQKLLKESWPKIGTQIFGAAIIAVCAKTIAALFLLSHYIDFAEIYKWLRITGWGEITINNNVIRVFSQSHIYALIGFVVFFFFLVNNQQIVSKKTSVAVSLLSLTTLIISLSRSMWVGLCASILFFLIYAIKRKWVATKILKAGAMFICFTILCAGLVWSIIIFPYPKKPLDLNFNIQQRFNMNEAAVVTRWSELKPLAKATFNHPIIGSGFGTMINFTNLDPRVLEKSAATNNYATYAFEWGYLDIILKIGLFGLFVYLAIIFDIAKKLFSNQPALFLSLIALLFTHIFTPYLNHPLGIGFIILTALL
jgi:hypothetical protein